MQCSPSGAARSLQPFGAAGLIIRTLTGIIRTLTGIIRTLTFIVQHEVFNLSARPGWVELVRPAERLPQLERRCRCEYP
jgi:hypothetical protein